MLQGNPPYCDCPSGLSSGGGEGQTLHTQFSPLIKPFSEPLSNARAASAPVLRFFIHELSLICQPTGFIEALSVVQLHLKQINCPLMIKQFLGLISYFIYCVQTKHW